MTYVELDLEDGLYEELTTLAEEEGVTVEELIIDILKDEFSLPRDSEEYTDDDYEDDTDEALEYDDDEN